MQGETVEPDSVGPAPRRAFNGSVTANTEDVAHGADSTECDRRPDANSTANCGTDRKWAKLAGPIQATREAMDKEPADMD